jgi:hypothetical protein
MQARYVSPTSGSFRGGEMLCVNEDMLKAGVAYHLPSCTHWEKDDTVQVITHSAICSSFVNEHATGSAAG